MSQVCGCREASCICSEPKAHEGPHVCDCGGSWDFKDGQFIVVNMPGPYGGSRIVPTIEAEDVA